jgi:glycosyltransferase involved in cell wall biosynthesis/protein-tyrosine-phosphatase
MTSPVRVCQIVSGDLWAGAEVQLAASASYLVERPDVDLTAILMNEGPLARELRRLGVPVTVIDESRHRALGILIAMTRWLRDHPVDVVHTHRYKETVLGAVAAKLSGVPCLVRTVHGQSEALRGWDRAKLRVYEALDAVTLRCFADRIIAVSRHLAQSLQASGYKPGTVVSIHNGVELRKVRAERKGHEVRQELGIGQGRPLIGTVGRLSPVKGHADFLRAARLILRVERAARFLIVGDGPLRGELAGLARQLQIDHACTFVGTRSDVADLVAAMDIFVLPSLDEGIPMALLEAMALGKPVVATAVGGVPEVVTDHVNGVLVRPRDAHALSEACLGLVREPGWAETVGARARRLVEDAFSHEQSGLQLVGAYRALTDGRRAASTPGVRSGLTALARVVRRSAAGARTFSERRRMEGIRRDPSRLAAALRSARHVLIVCKGNIIRSPFAARLIGQALDHGRRVRISSAGLEATPGTSPPPAATASAARHQVDVSTHVASCVTPEAVAASDVIFVMEVDHLRVIRRRYPQARSKTFLLTCLVPASPLEVADPFDGDDSAFRACFDHISESVRPIVRQLAMAEEAR